ISTSTLDGVAIGVSTPNTGAFTSVTVNGSAVCLANGTNCQGGSNWSYDTNYGASTITPSSTISVWLKDSLYASSTAIIAGDTTIYGLLTPAGGIATSTIDNIIIGGTTPAAAYFTVFSGSFNTSTLDGVVIGGSTPATGTFTTFTANSTAQFNGAVTIGDNGDAVAINSNTWDITSDGTISGVRDIDPISNDTYDLGSYGTAWQDIYASGTIVVGDDNTGLLNRTLLELWGPTTWTEGGDPAFIASTTLQKWLGYDSSSNTFEIGTVDSDGTIYFTGLSDFRALGTTRLYGSLIELGNAMTDQINVTGRFANSLIPINNDAVDLGIYENAWKDIYASGTIYAGTDVVVAGQSVCLADGTNCSATSTAAGWVDGTNEIYLGVSADNVTVGGSGSLGKLTVLGDADEIQFVIKANGTQNKNLTQWQNSSNTILGYMSSAGNFGASGTLRVDGASTFAGTATFTGALVLGDGDDIAINSNDWDISSDGVITGASMSSTQLTDGGTIDFDWVDGEVADALTVSGGTIGSNNISGTLTTTGALTIGDNGDTITIDSSVWDVSAAGVATFHGLSTSTLDGVVIGGSTAAAGTFTTLTTTGGALLGDTVDDVIGFGGLIGTNFWPNANNTLDIGRFGTAWQDIYASGTIYGTDLNLGGSAVVGGIDMNYLNNDAIVKIVGPATYTEGGEPVLISSSTLQKWVTNDSASTTYDIATIDSNGTIYIGEDATLENLGTTYLWGSNIYLGDAITDSIYISGSIQGNLISGTNNTADIGVYENAWKDIYASGTIYATQLGSSDVPLIDIFGKFIYAGNSTNKLTFRADGGGEDISSTRSLYINYDNNQDVFIGAGGESSLYVSEGVILTNGFICVDNDDNCSFINNGYGRADGWVTVADDLAEDYLVNDFTIEAGDVVSFDRSNDTHVIRTTSTYNSDIIGVISTKPGLHIGYADDEMSKEDRRPVALAGRVPLKVSNENGAVQIGDYLTSASLPGYAMKMTEPGITVGRALSAFDGNSATSTLSLFVNVGWYNGDGTAISFGENSTQLSVSTDESNIGPITTADNDLDLAGHSILNIASLSGMEDLWQIDEAGNFITKGEIIKTIATSVGEKDFYPIYNEDPTIMLNGSGELLNGEARIMFDPALSEIMDPNELLSVTISMTSEGAQGIYVAEKSIADILVKEINGGMGSSKFDYIIIAKRKMNNVAASSQETNEDATIPETSTSTPDAGGFENSLLADNTTSTQETATSTPESSVIASDNATVSPEALAKEEAISSTSSTDENALVEGTDINQQIADLEQSISELQRLIDEASAITADSEEAPSSLSTNPALSDSIVIEESASSTPVANEVATSTIAGI
ncbi:hypothetical protein KKB41_01120, partial [Patescibacteria group bacterium]|nr:hypothetical protein [Patescibacteria group bacterium]